MAQLRFTQIAGMNLHYRMYSLDYFFDSMDKHGVSHIELWGGSPHLYSDTATDAQVKRIRQELNRRRLGLVCYTPEQIMYPFNIAAQDEAARRAGIAYFGKNIEIASALEAEYMLITSGWGYYNEPREEAWKRSCEALRTLADKAQCQGVTLLLEVLQPMESNLVTDLASLRRMLNEVGSAAMTGLIDTVAMAVAGETIGDYFRALGGVPHVHLIDGTPSGHLALGDGHLPVEAYLKQLAEHGYAGCLTLELADSAYLADPDAAFGRSVNRLRPLLSP
ncbi:sugar phosphate isomerase/epimerase family protein [Paenibacillus oleatilyticus]|uniref:sugar phosphate isomerase/epimerase family protein n=1 Tax=Paenibacillus oleatilyticus TaxID=2594886 RepID=UPI001C1FBE41|nr:TIM barrel protein [Paenibacillus oleatilyticus]MBU7318252.1 TIM barrel protein [Paenibacillus oleatilyticus]